ncbi:hypothetical protein [Occultella kanbiaonis]|uniref:hypothetical protein n=1 Tax=Occultella kanbiaonis TaxID=2675754 RepID=UPI0012B8E893|nr:hypothetical protein [Occultella kanbiaonis]
MRGLLSTLFVTWLGLIALQTLSGSGASGRVAEAFRDANTIIEKALDPTVPAIPDLRK